MARVRPPPSLLARAIGLLARREHSRLELARKLAPHAESREALDALLDDLARRKLLSEERYAEARAHALKSRYGSRRVAQDLRARGVPEDAVAEAVAKISPGELQRARAIWAKRFGAPPADALERARQMRFLAARGFSFDIIRAVVGGDGVEDPSPEL